MRNIVVLSFITLDGIIQAPGGPDEDTSGGFKYGGWTVPYFDEFLGEIMDKQMGHSFDLLLGRKTYDIFAAYWPNHADSKDPVSSGINKATKYVVSRSTRHFSWEGSVLVSGNVIDEIKKMKNQNGPELQVHGSANMIQTLLKHDLVDELWLKIFPVTLGLGKRLFADGTIPAAFSLTEFKVSPKKVIVASYKREGKVEIGSFAD